MDMNNNKCNNKMPTMRNGLRGISTSLLIAAAAVTVASFMPAPASAAGITPDSAAAKCRQWFSSVENTVELAGNRKVLIDMKRCMDLGVDPPLKVRPDYGRKPSESVARSQIPSRTCPPFATCLYSARVNSSGGQPLNYGMGGPGSTLNDLPVSSAYSAPQFIGHLPSEVPPHLTDGGTIYFYGEVELRVPNSSLIYEDAGMNYYADGSNETIKNGHVMVPPPDPRGDIMKQKPITVRQDTKMNFDDGGVMIMPAGFKGVIGSTRIEAGDTVIVNHAEDMMVPQGTKLYPFPQGSHPEGAHVNEANYEPYQGTAIKAPQGAIMTIQNKNVPGVEKWWN